MPPLRERFDELHALVTHWLTRGELSGYSARTVDPEVIELFRRYQWPDNLRELIGVIRRMCCRAEENTELKRKHLEEGDERRLTDQFRPQDLEGRQKKERMELIVRLKDKEKMRWKEIEDRVGCSSSTCRSLYREFKRRSPQSE
jgi:DNA-binding NtrC family response regulator